MKKLLIVIILSTTWNIALTQDELPDNFIGLTRNFIHTRMSEEGFDHFTPSKTLDNVDYDLYMMDPRKMILSFFYDKDTCIRYTKLYNKSGLKKIIADFDKRYTKVDAFHWTDDKAKVNILITVPANEALYAIAFTKIQ